MTGKHEVPVGDRFYFIPASATLVELIDDEELLELLGIDSADGLVFGRLLHPVVIESRVGLFEKAIELQPEDIVAFVDREGPLVTSPGEGEFAIISQEDILAGFRPPECGEERNDG